MILEALQKHPGAVGTVEKRRGGYWLVPSEGEPTWLGDNQRAAERTLDALAREADNEHYSRIGEERYGMTADPAWRDYEHEDWLEQADWLDWWEKTKNLANAD